MRWVMSRPRSVPSPTSLVAKNGSKIRDWPSGGIPLPLSITGQEVVGQAREAGGGPQVVGRRSPDRGHSSTSST